MGTLTKKVSAPGRRCRGRGGKTGAVAAGGAGKAAGQAGHGKAAAGNAGQAGAELTATDIRLIKSRLKAARLGLMEHQPFYAVLLMQMKFGIDENSDTACTDGETIYFGPRFVQALTDSELEFVLMHEILHVALNHVHRGEGMDHTIANYAADIVVNSNIMYSMGGNASAISLGEYGEGFHETPDGQEGYLYSMEQVYDMLQLCLDDFLKEHKDEGGFDNHDSWSDPGDNEDSDQESGDGGDSGKDDDGNDGSDSDEKDGQKKDSKKSTSKKPGKYHNDSLATQMWMAKIMEAAQIAQMAAQSRKGCGCVPYGVERIIEELTNPKTDWKTMLNDFIQEELCDYSFNPPDRRMQDSAFLLPDFNDTEETVKDILFMIDTSGSMSDDDIAEVYSEVKGAVDQFGGKLSGWLGFFDAEVVEPKPFTNEEEFKVIRPKGGGGTSFHAIFEYVAKHSEEITPVSIIILTDGYADFPEESAALGIPVLWVINNKEVTPPWGRVTRV